MDVSKLAAAFLAHWDKLCVFNCFAAGFTLLYKIAHCVDGFRRLMTFAGEHLSVARVIARIGSLARRGKPEIVNGHVRWRLILGKQAYAYCSLFYITISRHGSRLVNTEFVNRRFEIV